MASYQVRQRDPLLDQNTQAVLERRGKELVGAGLVLVGFLVALMLMSYSPEDPSWMAATDAPAQNILGRFGAAIASPLYIIAGYGSWGVALALMVWGARFVTHRGEERAMSRAVFVPIGVALVSVYASSLTPGADWGHSFGMGGLFGDTVMGALLGMLPVGASFGLKFLALVIAVAMLGMGLFVLGFDAAELRTIRRFLGRGSVLLYVAAMNLLGKGAAASVQAAQAAAQMAQAKAQERIAQRRAQAAGRQAPAGMAQDWYAEDSQDWQQDYAPAPAAPPRAAQSNRIRRAVDPEYFANPAYNPEPELIEQHDPWADHPMDAPSPDRIRARIADAVKSRATAPQPVDLYGYADAQDDAGLQGYADTHHAPQLYAERRYAPDEAEELSYAPSVPLRAEPALHAPAPAPAAAPVAAGAVSAVMAAVASRMARGPKAPLVSERARVEPSLRAEPPLQARPRFMPGAAAAPQAAGKVQPALTRSAAPRPRMDPMPEMPGVVEDAAFDPAFAGSDGLRAPGFEPFEIEFDDALDYAEQDSVNAFEESATPARALLRGAARDEPATDAYAGDWDAEDNDNVFAVDDEDDAPLTTPLTASRAPLSRVVIPQPEARRVVQNPVKKPIAPSRQAQAEAQPRLALEPQVSSYEVPPLNLLTNPASVQRHSLSDEALEENARMLENVLDDYGVKGEIVSVRPGPVVTMYELEPAPGLKASRVIGLADDIARSMSALSARVSTVPGRTVIGIELPNANREKVVLREILSARDFGDSAMRLPLALGKDIGGEPIIANLAKMPHLLIAGTTGSGKSVAINTMILSLLYKLSPEECRLIMIDPKMLELSVYDGIPHLLSPVVTDPKKAVVALKWVVGEMEERYRKMSKMGVRNIEGYNGRVREALARGETFKRTVQTGFDEDTGEPVFETDEFTPSTIPYIVVIVDEMADLMMVAGKEIEACIQRLAQMARASGIHLIMATQRPSVDVITGTIKANFPTRISFQVTSKIDSRTILGEQGAEQLLGMGDMLYMAGGSRITRIHGPFVSDEEVEEIVNHLKSFGPPEYMSGVVEGPDEGREADIDAVLGLGGGTDDVENALYDTAVAIVCKDRKCSTSYIQRKLGIGYNKAARLVEQMEEQGVVTAANHVGKREILVPEH
ncbi:DNA translocase FtsK 4TM domain-containing protein [Phaeovulum sp. W22_SRMD_FR3]|uniref:DNA translocase FtsK n=1 Tax=Phaeovulum sp. W22_SRMD_FR3 TaxID=3240274 RepID=UPI003F9D3197